MIRKPIGFDNRSYYRTYLIVLLATILALNGLDGTALGLVLPTIKSALQLSDTELGVLTGIAFSVFYATVGLPIGRWADRGDRVALIACTTALWGIMVMLVGAVQSFGDLLIVRIGVAVGEAGCIPAAFSLLADYFPRDERPSAVSKYLLGSSISLCIGYVAAGWLSSHYGWRAMFVCLGAPSVLVAPIVWWTMSEPRRVKGRTTDSVSRGDLQTIPQVIRALLRNRTFCCLLATQCVNVLFGSGLSVWQSSFFARSWGFSVEQLGLYFSVIYGVGGIIGLYCGGYVASRYAPKNERRQLRLFALVNVGYGVVSAFIYLSTNAYVSVALLGISVIGGALESGPVSAVTQTVVPERMRAICISVIYLFSNLLGAGLGPLAVGALSDALRPHLGDASLRYALFAMCPGYLAGGWLLWRAARSVVADTETASVTGAREPLENERCHGTNHDSWHRGAINESNKVLTHTRAP